MDGPPENDCCSICHANFHIPCQANCSHWFCGNCILQVWNHGSALHPCKCPLCRREITLLVPGEASSRQRQDPEVAEVLQRIERYNRLYGERANGLTQRMRDLPFLLKRLWQDLINPQRSLPLVMRARVYLARFGRSSPRKRLFDPAFWFMKVASNDMPLKMIVSAIYVLSPVDIIPEALLGIIGLLDDFIIVLICFLHVAALYRSVLVLRHGGS